MSKKYPTRVAFAFAPFGSDLVGPRAFDNLSTRLFRDDVGRLVTTTARCKGSEQTCEKNAPCPVCAASHVTSPPCLSRYLYRKLLCLQQGQNWTF